MVNTGTPICPQPLSRLEIIERAEQLTKGYFWSVHESLRPVFTICFDHIYEHFLYPEFGILLEENQDLGEDETGERVLGCFDALENKIYLDKVFKNQAKLISRKRVFTAWHEVGHAILHGPLLRDHAKAIGDGRILTNETSITPAAESVFERQANLFASRIAAPEWFLNYIMMSTFDLRRPIRFVGPGHYMLDVRGSCLRYTINSFQELCEVIAYNIRCKFGGLSVESLSYRVKESRWLLDVSLEPPTNSPFVLSRKVQIQTPVLADR